MCDSLTNDIGVNGDRSGRAPAESADCTTTGKKWRWSLVAPGAVLIIAVGLQAMSSFRQPALPRAPHIAASLSLSPAGGWCGRDLPVGANEFISKVAEKTLNYDEVVYREYRRGGSSFTVYAAYWGPGKMPTQLVASHTPDRCWTENGWRCLSMKFRQSLVVDGVALKPAEWRLFEPPSGGQSVYVLFWHLVEGRVYDYGERFNAIPDPYHWCKDAVQQALFGSREQHFIRIASSEDPGKLLGDPGFVEVMREITRLGLAAPSQLASR